MWQPVVRLDASGQRRLCIVAAGAVLVSRRCPLPDRMLPVSALLPCTMSLPAAPLPGSPLVPPPRLFTLRDGRSLAYSNFGAPLRLEGDGALQAASSPGAGAAAAASAASPALPPILYFHGFCSSRFEAGLLHADALHYGLSVVAVDRPGAGHSTLNPKQARASRSRCRVACTASSPCCLRLAGQSLSGCMLQQSVCTSPALAERGEHGRGCAAAAGPPGACASGGHGRIRWLAGRRGLASRACRS